MRALQGLALASIRLRRRPRGRKRTRGAPWAPGGCPARVAPGFEPGLAGTIAAGILRLSGVSLVCRLVDSQRIRENPAGRTGEPAAPEIGRIRTAGVRPAPAAACAASRARARRQAGRDGAAAGPWPWMVGAGDAPVVLPRLDGQAWWPRPADGVGRSGCPRTARTGRCQVPAGVQASGGRRSRSAASTCSMSARVWAALIWKRMVSSPRGTTG